MKKRKWFCLHSRCILGICMMTVLCVAAVSLTACGEKKGSTTVELKNEAGTKEDSEGTAEADADSGEKEESQKIDAKQALSLALAHAGLTEQDTVSNKVKEEMEDGQKIFEVEFVSSDGAEYEYELGAQDGRILSFSYDAEKVFKKTNVSGGEAVSEEEAKKAILERIPEAAQEEIKMVLTEDDGWLEYEAYLFYDGMQHEFQIDAGSGKLIEWEGEVLEP